jgi:hypothetical protein
MSAAQSTQTPLYHGASGHGGYEGPERALHLSVETASASKVSDRYPKRWQRLDDLGDQDVDIICSESLDALVEDVRDDCDVPFSGPREELANPLDMLGISKSNIAVRESGT